MTEIDYLELTTMCIENEQEGSQIRIFDWLKAAEIITENNVMNAEAFIKGDESRTAGRIINDGKLVADHDAILESYCSVPTLRDIDTMEEWECYKYRPATNWTAESILKIAGGELVE